MPFVKVFSTNIECHSAVTLVLMIRSSHAGEILCWISIGTMKQALSAALFLVYNYIVMPSEQ